jgi:hypothetical protein
MWFTLRSKLISHFKVILFFLYDMLKTGEITEFGFFLGVSSGYMISEGEPADTFRKVAEFFPAVTIEPREIIPYETGKEIIREVTKAKVEAAKK